jgi:zinc/manganese transport system substrate-binding protein
MLVRNVLVCAALACTVLLAGCGTESRAGRIEVVAAENVYGDILSQIGGARVRVTSVLSDPSADPHLFEPGTASGLAVAHARLVVQNGAGYDPFMERLERAAPSDGRRVLVVADLLGVHGASANPHLWYDLRAVDGLAGSLAEALIEADTAHAASYRQGLQRFRAGMRPVLARLASVRAAARGAPVATTERVPGYLLAAAGLRDLAPASFTRPIEQGSEPSARAVSAMVALVAQRHVRVLLYNTQAISPITVRVRAAARAAGVPVVGVTETLPRGLSFQRWQLRQLAALQQALAS